jgi:hypothetical protein
MGQSLESHYRQSNGRDISHLENLFAGMFGPEGRIRAKEAMLLDEGFSQEEIAQIKQICADLKINVLQPHFEQSLPHVASCALQIFQWNYAPVVFKFNGVSIVVQEGDNLGTISERYAQLQTRPEGRSCHHLPELEAREASPLTSQ